MATSTKAIVLSKENFGESDQYVQFLTQDYGVITALAKGARNSKRRYIGGLDLFCHDEIYLKGEPKEKTYLLELKVLNAFTGIRDHLEKVMISGKTVQWIKKLSNVNIPIPKIYSLLGQTLSLIELESDVEKLELLLLVFKWKLLGLIGVQPKIYDCAKCSSALSDLTFFDLSIGGLLCKSCSTQVGFDESYFIDREQREILNITQNLKLTDWNQITFKTNKSRQLSVILSQFAAYHFHTRLPN